MYEHYVSKGCLKENCPGIESLNSEGDSSRIRNTLWCSCSKYKSKATHAESICCLDKEKIPQSYAEGILSFSSVIFLSGNMLVTS